MARKLLQIVINPPWDKQPREMHYDWFAKYLELPKPSAEKVAKECAAPPDTVKSVCTANRWVERRDLWVEHNGRRIIEDLERAIPEMRNLHTEVARAFLTKATQTLSRLSPDEITAVEAIKMFEAAVKTERLSRGEVTERTEGSAEISGNMTVAADPFDGLTTEELREYIRARKAEG